MSALPRRASRGALFCTIAVGLALLAGVASKLHDEASTPVLEPLPSHPIAFYDERAFAEALNRTESDPVKPMPGAQVVIVPHHWVAGYLIMEGIRDLAATRHISRVFLVGPDHVNAGNAPATTSAYAWNTPFGQLAPNSAAIESLIAAGAAAADPDTLGHEHSVAGIVHALAYYMPHAVVVPLALRHDMTLGEVTALAAAVEGLIDDETAVIISEDFSHDLSAPEAEANDKQTLATLTTLDSARIMGWGNEHLDSPPSVAFAIELSKFVADGPFVLRENTNSGFLSGTFAPPVTSYIAGYYPER